MHHKYFYTYIFFIIEYIYLYVGFIGNQVYLLNLKFYNSKSHSKTNVNFNHRLAINNFVLIIMHVVID